MSRRNTSSDQSHITIDNPSHERLKKLPRWATAYIAQLKREITRRDGLVAAHALLCESGREWFTIPNRTYEKPMKLWLLDRDSPIPVCSIGNGDTLLIGRAKNNDRPAG